MAAHAASPFLKFFRLVVPWGAVGLLAWFAQPLKPAPAEAARMANRFHFVPERFPQLETSTRNYRNVNPRLERLKAWISTVGAGVALGDLDGDGLSNDACLVDPRSDDVLVTPVPGTGAHYQPFALSPQPLPYDRSSMAPMGCLLVDLNEDGLRDIVVYYWGRTPVAFLRRQAEQRLPITRESFVAQELVPGAQRWYSNAGLAADVDGDGHADLIFGNYFPDGSMILGDNGPAEMQASMSRANNGGSKPVLLWKSATAGDQPSVQMTPTASLEPVLGHGWTLAMAACDIDGDLLPDLYIANDYGPDLLLHNVSTPGRPAFEPLRGTRGWTTPKSKVLGQDSFKGMGVDCADLNGDGLPDLMVGNITDTYALEESNLVFMSTGDLKLLKTGVAPYQERGESLGLARSGWSWDVRFGDFDNDGVAEIVQATGFLKGSTNRWPQLQELAMGNDLMLRDPAHWPLVVPGDDLSGSNHDHFYVRSHAGPYFDLAPAIGLGEAYITRGVAAADVDGDGRLDFVLANQWADSFVFHNRSDSSGAFLGLHLLLPTVPAATSIRDGLTSAVPGYPALGARVTVFLPHNGKLVQQVDGGNGHSGKSSPDLHFGLGNVENRALDVAFDWRDRHGTVRHQQASLLPGWHTVVLGDINQ